MNKKFRNTVEYDTVLKENIKKLFVEKTLNNSRSSDKFYKTHIR